MNNSKGSTLAIALSMLFLFSAMGVGALEYGGGQRQFATTQIANTQAFWIADAGLLSVCLSGTAPSTPTSFGPGTYSVTPSGTVVAGGLLTATGTVNGEKRIVKANCMPSTPFSGLVAGGNLNSNGLTFLSGNAVYNGSSSGMVLGVANHSMKI